MPNANANTSASKKTTNKSAVPHSAAREEGMAASALSAVARATSKWRRAGDDFVFIWPPPRIAYFSVSIRIIRLMSTKNRSTRVLFFWDASLLGSFARSLAASLRNPFFHKTHMRRCHTHSAYVTQVSRCGTKRMRVHPVLRARHRRLNHSGGDCARESGVARPSRIVVVHITMGVRRAQRRGGEQCGVASHRCARFILRRWLHGDRVGH